MRRLVPVITALAMSIATVVFYNLGWGLQFTVICIPILTMFVIDQSKTMAEQEERIDNLEEQLVYTQQKVLEIAAAIKSDFDKIQEHFGDEIHKVVNLIADDRFGPSE